MYSPAFQALIADSRIEDLRRARGTSFQRYPRRGERRSRAAARWGLLGRARIRQLAFPDPARLTSGPRP